MDKPTNVHLEELVRDLGVIFQALKPADHKALGWMHAALTNPEQREAIEARNQPYQDVFGRKLTEVLKEAPISVYFKFYIANHAISQYQTGFGMLLTATEQLWNLGIYPGHQVYGIFDKKNAMGIERWYVQRDLQIGMATGAILKRYDRNPKAERDRFKEMSGIVNEVLGRDTQVSDPTELVRFGMEQLRTYLPEDDAKIQLWINHFRRFYNQDPLKEKAVAPSDLAPPGLQQQ